MAEQTEKGAAPGASQGGPGIKSATGFLFTIVASLLLSDYLTNAVKVMNEFPHGLNFALLLGAGINLLRIVIDNFIYYDATEPQTSGWAAYRWRLALTTLEIAVLLLCYDLVFQFEHEKIQGARGFIPTSSLQRIALDFALVEGAWLLWDFGYLRYTWHLRRKGMANPNGPGPQILRIWMIMNGLWAGLFLSLALWLRAVDLGERPLGIEVVLLAVFSGLCPLSYLVFTKHFYAPEGAHPSNGASEPAKVVEVAAEPPREPVGGPDSAPLLPPAHGQGERDAVARVPDTPQGPTRDPSD